jgi:hypothetical protein
MKGGGVGSFTYLGQVGHSCDIVQIYTPRLCAKDKNYERE